MGFLFCKVGKKTSAHVDRFFNATILIIFYFVAGVRPVKKIQFSPGHCEKLFGSHAGSILMLDLFQPAFCIHRIFFWKN